MIYVRIMGIYSRGHQACFSKEIKFKLKLKGILGLNYEKRAGKSVWTE